VFGFGKLGLGFGVSVETPVASPADRVQGSGFMVQGSGFRVQGSGFTIWCSGLGFGASSGGQLLRRPCPAALPISGELITS